MSDFDENGHPKAPVIDMSKIQNVEAITKVGGVVPTEKRNFKKRGSGKFNFVEPELVPLPSGGRLYNTEDPDIQNGYIAMYPMTVKEEEILSTSRFLKAGIATRMVIDNCIASNFSAKDILLYDSNYLLFYLRKISYGDNYKFELKCPSCDKSFDHQVNISELHFNELPETVKEPFSIKLGMSKYRVDFILPRLFHSEEIYQRNQNRKKSTSDADQRLVDNFMVTTISITGPDGSTVDKRDWPEFFLSLPGADRAQLSEAADYTTGVDKLENVLCPYCNTDFGGTIPIGVEFFRF